MIRVPESCRADNPLEAPVQLVDLRSDTVTRPTPAMRAAMAEAEVGDDVFGEDPTVNRIEAMAAERFGHESALFVSSGTQGNFLALLSHCGRGDEYVCGQQAHNYRTEGGGAAALGGIQPQPIEVEADGTLDLDRVAASIKPHDFHSASPANVARGVVWRPGAAVSGGDATERQAPPSRCRGMSTR